MANDIVGKSLTYAKNVSRNAERVVKGKQSAKDALANVAQDTRRMKKVVESSRASKEHKKAVKYVVKGRELYNGKKYEKAEPFFRHALVIDPEYPRAMLYLGHTYYKMGHLEQAKKCWDKVIEMAPETSEASKARGKLQHLRRRTNEVMEGIRQGMRRPVFEDDPADDTDEESPE